MKMTIWSAMAVLGVAGAALGQVDRVAKYRGPIRPLDNPTDADVLVDQFVDTTFNSGWTSQDFTDPLDDPFDVWEFDDFTITETYSIEMLTARGFNDVQGGELFNEGLEAMITRVAPGGGPDVNAIVMSTTTGSQVVGDVIMDFGGQKLDPGTYFIGVRVVRDITTGGQWFWLWSTKLGLGISGDVNGDESWAWNPGGGWGIGTVPIRNGDTGFEATDHAYQLTGTLAGGCGCVCNYDTSTGADVCDFFDFITFQDLFATGDDCGCELDTSTGPGVCDFFDFISFQDAFSAGC